MEGFDGGFDEVGGVVRTKTLGQDVADAAGLAHGADGSPGVSVTSNNLAPGDPNCPHGGSSFTSASGTTYACNGQDGTGGSSGHAYEARINQGSAIRPVTGVPVMELDALPAGDYVVVANLNATPTNGGSYGCAMFSPFVGGVIDQGRIEQAALFFGQASFSMSGTFFVPDFSYTGPALTVFCDGSPVVTTPEQGPYTVFGNLVVWQVGGIN